MPFDWDSQFPIEQGVSRRTEDVFCDIVWILFGEAETRY